eukprot:GILK01007080.1.p1 GENE.GILK01007080.1~~GILK01007080.1.p1  ORF type:complete len:636 (-),score=121.89 GILK01007080.1:14-1921(-)
MVKILVAGDSSGSIAQLFSRVETVNKQHGPFAALLCVGAFMQDLSSTDPSRSSGLAPYVSGEKKVPLPTYFVEGGSGGGALLHAMPDGGELCENVTFLGRSGIREICGLQVAYLSGIYDPLSYRVDEDGNAAAAYTGLAYRETDIQRLHEISKQDGFRGVDVLLTSEWPKGYQHFLTPELLPADLTLPTTVGSPAVAAVALQMRPRYHFAGMEGVFYQRLPYQNDSHVTRLICMGKVNAASPEMAKKHKFLHALNVTPLTALDKEQQPPNTTVNPYSNVPEPPKQAPKRAREENPPGQDQHGTEFARSKRLYVGNLNYKTQELTLQRFFSQAGAITNIAIPIKDGRPRGMAFIDFETEEQAEAALATLNGSEIDGRMIRIGYAANAEGDRSRDDGPPRKQQRSYLSEPVVTPHADCWFCLSNPKVEKHLIVSIGENIYVALAKGGIVPQHVLLLPITHYPSYLAVPDDVAKEIEQYKDALRSFFASQNQEVVIFERNVPMSNSSAMHMNIQVVPIPKEAASEARPTAESMGHANRINFESLPSDGDIRTVLPPSEPYFYLELPGLNTAKGKLTEKLLHRISGTRHPLQFGRDVAAHILGMPDRADWKACRISSDEEQKIASAFKKQFKPFQPNSS